MFCLTQVSEDTFVFDHPELKLCGVQDVEIQLLTSLFTSFIVSCFFLTSVFKLYDVEGYTEGAVRMQLGWFHLFYPGTNR